MVGTSNLGSWNGHWSEREKIFVPKGVGSKTTQLIGTSTPGRHSLKIAEKTKLSDSNHQAILPSWFKLWFPEYLYLSIYIYIIISIYIYTVYSHYLPIRFSFSSWWYPQEFYVHRLVRHLQSQSQMEPPSLDGFRNALVFVGDGCGGKWVCLKIVYSIFPMVLLIIIPIKWLFVWEYSLFSDKPKWSDKKNSELARLWHRFDGGWFILVY